MSKHFQIQSVFYKYYPSVHILLFFCEADYCGYSLSRGRLIHQLFFKGSEINLMHEKVMMK